MEPLMQEVRPRATFRKTESKSRALIVIGLYLRRCRVGLRKKTNGNTAA